MTCTACSGRAGAPRRRRGSSLTSPTSPTPTRSAASWETSGRTGSSTWRRASRATAGSRRPARWCWRTSLRPSTLSPRWRGRGARASWSRARWKSRAPVSPRPPRRARRMRPRSGRAAASRASVTRSTACPPSSRGSPWSTVPASRTRRSSSRWSSCPSSGGESLPLSSGARAVDWVHVDDVTRGLEAAAAAPDLEGRTVDLGSGRLVTIREVVERIFGLMGVTESPRWDALPGSAPRAADRG